MSRGPQRGFSRRRERAFAIATSAPAVAALCALGLVLMAPGGHAESARARVGHAESVPAHVAVATESAPATRAAVAQLDAGGNAVDAVVCAALVSGVTAPSSSGLGGGGFAMLWDAKSSQAHVVDFRETAPAAIDAAAFETRPFKPAERGRATGVPGELAGLALLHDSFGKRPWKDVVRPAAHLAETGFEVSPHLAHVLLGAAPNRSDGSRTTYGDSLIVSDAGLFRVFFPGGRPAPEGRQVKNPKLGRSLERIAALGKAALYAGDLGRDLTRTVREKGGALSEGDLQDYRPIARQALHVTWEGYDVYTMPPPSAGGLMLAETLGMFSKAELARMPLNSGLYQHTLAEAMRGALADRLRYLGDPDFERDDVARLLEPKRLAARKLEISSERTHALPRFDSDEHGTHHMIAVDAAGNVASITTTVNTAFGAKFTGTESGIVANDELTDFNRQKDVAAFGLRESPNRPRAGARPVSSMTPTLVVKDGKVVLAIGGSGGPLIATNVTELLLARLVFGLSASALVQLPRFAVPTAGPSLLVESGAPKPLLADLAWRGEVVVEMPENPSAVQLVTFDEMGVDAASDPRKHGSALGK